MGSRLELQSLLERILGSRNVYFQPPDKMAMSYPCIVYELDDLKTEFANNLPYRHKKRYRITSIDKNPDSLTPGNLAALPMSSFNRMFSTTGLNHQTYTIYF